MIPTPGLPRQAVAATAARSPISSADLAAWIERRRRLRRKVMAGVIVLLSMGVAVLAVYWTAFNRHLLAMANLQSHDFMVDWDLNLANLSTGGTTYVAHRGGYSWHRKTFRAEDLESLKGLNHIRTLDLAGLTAFRDDDLALISGLGELEELDLSRLVPDTNAAAVVVPLGDRVLDHIKGLTRLKSLGLAGDRITDAGLAKLANLQALEMLDLDGTLVTNAGLDALVGLKGLKTLRVDHTPVTRKGAARFQQKRPDVEVIRETETMEDPGNPVP